MVINVDTVRRLEKLTLAAVDACAIRIHLRAVESSPFNPELAVEERLRLLGKALGEICTLSAEGVEKERLSTALIELAALATIWAEIADKQQDNLVLSPGMLHYHRFGQPCAGYRHETAPYGDTYLGR